MAEDGFEMNVRPRGRKIAEVRQMSCPERARLLKAYASGSAELARVIAALATAAYAGEPGFDRAWSRCEEVRSRCEQIQRDIYEHVQDHSCALDIGASPRTQNGPDSSPASRL